MNDSNHERSAVRRTLSGLRVQLTELGLTADVDTFSPGEQDEQAAVTLARGAFRQAYRLVDGDHGRPMLPALGDDDLPTLVFRRYVSP